jgi:endonuclease/exonuclease/phosphatase (EEP) superfamily protein YafD
MVTFLFWNLNRLPRQDVVAQLVAQHGVDVLILAESEIPDAMMLGALTREAGRDFQKPWSLSKRIHVFTCLPEPSLTTVMGSELDRLTIHRLIIGSRDILLAAVHLQSKLYLSDEEQFHATFELATEIRRVEAVYGHRRTVVVGDFNMNPFEAGLISSFAFHSVMTREIAAKGHRVVSGREYPFFYNPMWGFFGDQTPGPSGTYFYSDSSSTTMFWNIFDQVLFRPDLLDWYNDDLTILEECGNTRLKKESGRPDPESGSDHFPILFRLNPK